jgi:hypothetical protein
MMDKQQTIIVNMSKKQNKKINKTLEAFQSEPYPIPVYLDDMMTSETKSHMSSQGYSIETDFYNGATGEWKYNITKIDS